MDSQYTKEQPKMPVLFPCDPEVFWERVRIIVREELSAARKEDEGKQGPLPSEFSYKPMYRLKEVCSLFQITKPTLYDWIKKGKLKPLRISSRPYFLLKDLQELLLRR